MSSVMSDLGCYCALELWRLKCKHNSRAVALSAVRENFCIAHKMLLITSHVVMSFKRYFSLARNFHSMAVCHDNIHTALMNFNIISRQEVYICVCGVLKAYVVRNDKLARFLVKIKRSHIRPYARFLLVSLFQLKLKQNALVIKLMLYLEGFVHISVMFLEFAYSRTVVRC